MPIDFPNFNDTANRTRADVQSELPDSNPSLLNSLLNAIVISFSSRITDVYSDLSRLLREKFTQTASNEFLDEDGEIFGIERLQANKASGKMVIQGTPTTNIPASTQFSNPSGGLYTSTASATIGTTVLSVNTLIRIGSVAQASFTSAHELATGISVTIAGANETEYNGTFTITVIDELTIEYTIVGTPSSPATGTITLTTDVAKVSIESDETGSEQNQVSGVKMTLSAPIVGVNNSGFVDFLGITGGRSIEEDDPYRERIIAERSGLEALFNVAQIEEVVFLVDGVTRAKVKEITPSPGAITVLFVKDDNPGSIIPNASEIAQVKNAILEIKPAHTDNSDIVVLAPTPVTVDFNFTALSPNTPEIKAAINSNLAALFRESVDFEQDVTEDRYRGVIATTIDPSSGDIVESFTLSTPSGDVTISSNELAVLGSISYSV